MSYIIQEIPIGPWNEDDKHHRKSYSVAKPIQHRLVCKTDM